MLNLIPLTRLLFGCLLTVSVLITIPWMPRHTIRQESPAITLEQVYARVRKLTGVTIKAQMVRPSSIPMEFKIARGGGLYAKYPTSEMYISLADQVTWMPDRREFVKEKREAGNPLPAGFEILWPQEPLLQPNGKPQTATFAGKPTLEIPCKAAQGHTVLLYVDPKSLLPVGSLATANGTEFELRYISVRETPLAPKDLTFQPPADAKPFSGAPPDSQLIKAGAKLPIFRGRDASGKPLSYEAISKSSHGLVLNFWFSACTGCVQELPFFAKLAAPLQSQGIGLIGVNPIDKERDVQGTAKIHKLPYPTLTGSGAKELSKSVGVIAYPVTVVVDSQGVIVDAIMGFNEQRLMKALEKIGYQAKQ